MDRPRGLAASSLHPVKATARAERKIESGRKASGSAARATTRFSVTAGTTVQAPTFRFASGSSLIYLMLRRPAKGMSANQLKRTLGVQYKTAWYLCHRMQEEQRATIPSPAPRCSASSRWTRPWSAASPGARAPATRATSTRVAGAIERGGRVPLRAESPTSANTRFRDFVRRTVSDEAEAIYTDVNSAPRSASIRTPEGTKRSRTAARSGSSEMSTPTASRASGRSSNAPSPARSTS